MYTLEVDVSTHPNSKEIKKTTLWANLSAEDVIWWQNYIAEVLKEHSDVVRTIKEMDVYDTSKSI